MKTIKKAATSFLALTLILTAPGLIPYQAAAQQIHVRTRTGGVSQMGVRALPRIGGVAGLGVGSWNGILDVASKIPGATTLIPSVQRTALGAGMVSAPVGTADITPASPVDVVKIAGQEASVKTESESIAPSVFAGLKEGLTAAERSERVSSDGLTSKGTWDRFWTAVRLSDSKVPAAGVSPETGVAPSGLTASAPKTGKSKKVPPVRTQQAAGKSVGARLFAGVGLAAISIPEWVLGLWTQYSPYAYGLMILGGARLVQTKVVKPSIDKLGKTLGWEGNSTAVVNLVASLALWTGGAYYALLTAGVPTEVLLGILGIGGLTISLAAKGAIRNFLEAVKLLVTRPFMMGDTIEVGGKKLVAEDMTLRRFVLRQEDGNFTKMKHATLAGKAITLQGPYYTKQELLKKVKETRVRFSFSGLFTRLRKAGKHNFSSLVKPAFWTLATAGLLFYGLPVLQGAVIWGLFQTMFPFIQAATMLWVSSRAAKLGAQAVTVLGEKLDWSLQTTVMLKLAARALSFGVGGTFAMATLGMSWAALLTGGVAGSIAITWSAAGIMGNFIEGIVNLSSRDILIGKHLKVGDVEGKVIDLNINYVVIGHEDGSYTLVPHALVKNAPLEDIPEHALKGE